MSNRLLLLTACAILMGATEAYAQSSGAGDPPPFDEPGMIQLANSACAGSTSGVLTAIAEGADPNGLGQQGVTPLFWALRCQSYAGAEALLNNGADPNLLISGDLPPTYFASLIPDVRFLRLLLKHGGDPNLRYGTDYFNSALDEALLIGESSGQWDHWRLLLDSGADINSVDKHGGTIATKAAWGVCFKCVLELLRRGYSHDLSGLRAILTGEVMMRGSGRDADRIECVRLIDQQLG